MKNITLFALILILGTACGSKEVHSTIGVVKQVRDQGKVLVVAHEDFSDFMEGMTMPFEVARPSLAKNLKAGDKIAFTIEKMDDSYEIIKIRLMEKGAP